MIFEEIVLHHFGIYKDRHVIPLAPPSPRKPIILLGGLNGSGKTTLLEALQLVLYGKLTPWAPPNYLEYLRQMIHHHVDPKMGAALELQFKHYRAGQEESIRIHRSWFESATGIKEQVEVKRNGLFDSMMTKRWYEYVEEFMPVRISSLFFFDGEKIEAFADPNKAAELLRMGIQALLGLDLVDRLLIDLVTVERKRKAQQQSQVHQAQIKTLETDIDQLTQQSQTIEQQKQETQAALIEMDKKLVQLENEYRREGGELLEQSVQFETQLKAAKNHFSQIENQLRELAAGEVPLLLVQDLLRETENQARQEQIAQRYHHLETELDQRDAMLLRLLKDHAVNDSVLTAIETFFQTDKTKRQQLLETDCYLNVDPGAFAPLQVPVFEQIQATIQNVIEQAAVVTEEIHYCERQLDSIPDPEQLEGLTQQRKQLQIEKDKNQLRLETLAQEQHRLHQELARKHSELVQLCEREAQEQFAHETTHRVLKHSEKVRRTLNQFGQALTKKHIQQLETLILDSFHQLIRKEQGFDRLMINPTNYKLTLYTDYAHQLSANHLSAGERQLLAVSILWGLSRASGRPLPAIIDTPLSRLDGQHRQNLIHHYFPHASHQVILLSTDEEINEKYYPLLKPMIGHEYHIHYEEKQQASVIRQGYFYR